MLAGGVLDLLLKLFVMETPKFRKLVIVKL